MSSSRPSSFTSFRRLWPLGIVIVLALAGVSLLIPKVQNRLFWEWERLTARVKDTVDLHPITVSMAARTLATFRGPSTTSAATE